MKIHKLYQPGDKIYPYKGLLIVCDPQKRYEDPEYTDSWEEVTCALCLRRKDKISSSDKLSKSDKLSGHLN